MKPLENILKEIEVSQSQIEVLIKEVNQLQKFNLKNIVFNREKEINKVLFKIGTLQGSVRALIWVISE